MSTIPHDQDGLNTKWWIYREAGTYAKEISIPNNAASVTTLAIPEDAGGYEIHVILEIQDRSEIVPLYDYRRIVLSVESSG